MQPLSLLERPPLVPTSGNSNTNFAPSSNSNNKKRKHGDDEDNEPLPENFNGHLLSKSQTISFTAVTLVARACLPLAWLDVSSQSHQQSPPLVFEAFIQAVQEWEQRILVARRLTNGVLHAIERVGQNTYIACALHTWVSEQRCKDAAIGMIADINVTDLVGIRESSIHTRTSSTSSINALPTPKSPKKPTNRRGALARKSILMPKDHFDIGQLSEMTSSPSLLPQQPLTPSNTSDPLPLTPTAQTEQENLLNATSSINVATLSVEPASGLGSGLGLAPMENPISSERLRNQYFEQLYSSKTSLAFYVKGPLSRARAHVRTSLDSTASILELAEFYRQSILPAAKIDLKYKESLSRIVNELPIDGDMEENQKKKGGKKRIKLGKDSLWPNEEGFVQKWWRGRELKSGLSSTDNHAEELRKQTAELRTRETKMQLLLILEVMLLELAASRLSEQPVTTDLEIKAESIEDDSAAIIAKAPHKQPKKKRDFSGEIDTMVDRLCIWHTVSFEDFTMPEKKDDGTKSKTNDSLRDFCKDVLIPFYAAKLPDQIKALSRKLGGAGTSPKRPKLQSRSSQLSRSKSAVTAMPKAPTSKPVAKRTLERVLSEDQAYRHASPPTLSRASSGPISSIIPSLKREPSERPLSRGSMLSKSVSFSNREIDLVADSRTHEAKRQKLDRLAQQKRELEAAIESLKKPNRRTVAGAFMDEVEQRKAQSSTQVVHITATPRARRIRDQELLEPELPPMPATITARSQELTIPSSSIRPRFDVPTSSSIPRSSATKRAVLTAIHETPSRGLERKTSNPLALQQELRPYSTGGQVHAVAATPAPPRSHIHLDPNQDLALAPHPSSDVNFSSSQGQSPNRGGLRMSRSLRPVLFTPLRKSEVRIEDAFRDAPEIPEKAGKMMDRVMGGRGVDVDLDLDLDLDLNVGAAAALSSSPPGVVRDENIIREADYFAPEHPCVGGGARQSRVDDDGDIYAQLGWNDDFDL